MSDMKYRVVKVIQGVRLPLRWGMGKSEALEYRDSLVRRFSGTYEVEAEGDDWLVDL